MYPGCGVIVSPVTTVPANAPAPKQEKSSLPNQARILVQLPADAKLYVDDQLSNQSATPRTLVTPVLQNGRDYTYTLRVEAVRNGQTVVATKDVVFRAGDNKAVEFGDLAGKATAKVTVTLPATAKLYVDDILCPQTSSTRSFETPEMPYGQKYYYTMKTEYEQDGKVQTTSRQVIVEAGQQIKVDFGTPTSVASARP